MYNIGCGLELKNNTLVRFFRIQHRIVRELSILFSPYVKYRATTGEEGKALGTVTDVRLDSLERVNWGLRWRYGVYWRGALYALSWCICYEVPIIEAHNCKPLVNSSIGIVLLSHVDVSTQVKCS